MEEQWEKGAAPGLTTPWVLPAQRPAVSTALLHLLSIYPVQPALAQLSATALLAKLKLFWLLFYFFSSGFECLLGLSSWDAGSDLPVLSATEMLQGQLEEGG